MSNTMRDAAKLEASALYESEDTYNYAEEALAIAFERGAAWQAAQSQPAPPVPSSVQEIMPLVSAYVRACIKCSRTPLGEIEAASEGYDEALKPLEAALTALVDERDRLRFELDVVRAMRGPLPSHQEMADAMVSAERGFMCPLCGWNRPHEHSPEEIIIYRNGVKWGRSNGKEPWIRTSHQGAAQAERPDTSAIGGAMRDGEDEHHEHRAGQPNPDRTHDQRDSASDGLSGESQIREAVATAETDVHDEREDDAPPPTHGIEPEQGGNHG